MDEMVSCLTEKMTSRIDLSLSLILRTKTEMTKEVLVMIKKMKTLEKASQMRTKEEEGEEEEEEEERKVRMME